MNRFLLLTFLACFGTALTAQTLVAHYPFDGNANDVTPFMNNATVGGAELTEGWDGTQDGAYSFDGDRDSIFAAAAAHLNTPTATYAMWVNVEELIDAGEYYIFCHGNWRERMKISLPNHGYPVFTTNTADGIFDGDANPEALVPGVWTHLTFVHANDTNYIYINGQLAKREGSDRIGGGLSSTDMPLSVGANCDDSGNYFKGDIDDVRIYGSGMTREQVADLYNMLLASSSTQEVAFGELGRAFPNPTSETLYFEHELALDGKTSFALVDPLGREVHAGVLTDQRQAISVDGMPSGVYTLRVQADTRSAATRVIVR